MLTSALTAVAIYIGMAQLGDVDRYTPSVSPTGDPILNDCNVRIQDDIRLPAQEPGVLIHLAVREGSQVQSGQEIGKIDDTEPQMQKEVAGYAYHAALKRFTEDIEIRFQKAAAAVAEAEVQRMEDANRRVRGSISESELRRAKLEHTKATLGIEKTQHEQELAKYDAATRRAELKAAEVAIQRRAILAPFDGEVVELLRHQDEWVSPGDPILRLVRLDTMNVEGFVDGRAFDPVEIDRCKVTIEVEMARGRTVSFPGRITWVSPLVDRHLREYPVRAEVVNRREDGRWVLRDGLRATMTIHLGTSGDAPTASLAP